MAKKVMVLGAGGHSKVVINALHLSGVKISKTLDIHEEVILKKMKSSEVVLVNGIGSVDVPSARKNIFEKYKALGFEFLTVIHPSAIVAPDVKIQEGAQIMAGVTLQPGISIGANSIINTGAILDHDVQIGDHCHVAPGVTMSGGVTVGSSTHIGTGAVVIQSIKIGSECLVGAGTVVHKNLENKKKALGVAMKVFKKK